MKQRRKTRRYTLQDYEAAKQYWSFMHPEATPSQYEQAMRAIAARMGI